ncbi:uncharacterized protein LOC126787154 [Argentina anserina]|uniref:uncharacterized protein LOC126787154 n=1 Tax=Argentina anserina TaxID=57926 RepID=UPI0021765E39|nr:uncharacterized protein LOC126787154 [Potentilla anserina]
MQGESVEFTQKVNSLSLTHSEVFNKEMHAMWVSLTENIKCGTKLSDVVGLRERCDRSRNSGEASSDGELVLAHGKDTPFRELMYHPSYTQAQLFASYLDSSSKTIFIFAKWYELEFVNLNFHLVFLPELSSGDPSRDIIEMIVRKASMNPSKPSGKIKTVLRVKNSVETLEMFEKYREKVKKVAKERCMRHPRITVDGNELMRFYCTTMACCNVESRRVPELCNGPTCRVCRLIHSSFDTEYVLENGIQLSTSSENTIAVTRASKAKRAVIVCRTIAGSIVNVDDQEYDESESIGNRNLHSTTTEYLLVQNPSAVLPCFVIVFN